MHWKFRKLNVCLQVILFFCLCEPTIAETADVGSKGIDGDNNSVVILKDNDGGSVVAGLEAQHSVSEGSTKGRASGGISGVSVFPNKKQPTDENPSRAKESDVSGAEDDSGNLHIGIFAFVIGMLIPTIIEMFRKSEVQHNKIISGGRELARALILQH